MIEIKVELNELKMTLLTSAATPDDPVMQDQSRAEMAAFDCLLVIKKCLRSIPASSATAREATTTKLPKLELPAFHGDVVQWKNFWEQFCISVHAPPVQYSQEREVNVLTKHYQGQDGQEFNCRTHEID